MYFSYCLTNCTSIFVVVFLVQLHALIPHHVITAGSPSTDEANVLFEASLCEIHGGQSVTGLEFSPSTVVFPCHSHCTNASALLNETVLFMLTL